jgi:DNA-binding NarL/FixJ family response regulator
MNLSGHKRKIFLVDDHPLVREWLTQLINQQSDLLVCGETESAPAALSAMAAAQPDLAIVDISLKSSSGVELIKNLKELHPGVPVLVLSMHDESLYAERVLRAGARGYINKRETAQKVVAAIRRVLEGKLYISEKIAEAMTVRALTGKPAASQSPVELLSDRELEVFEKLAQGIGTRQIAEDLGVNIKTIQAYCARIKEKLNLTSANKLLREAILWNETKRSR